MRIVSRLSCTEARFQCSVNDPGEIQSSCPKLVTSDLHLTFLSTLCNNMISKHLLHQL